MTEGINFLLIEPFYGGSHKQLIHFITKLLSDNGQTYHLSTLPAKKWHWRARTSALYMYKHIPMDVKYKVIFCSSVLNLAELIALRPDLATALKVIYFHENQFIYPKRMDKERDFQYGYSTITSALVADRVIFNSQFNLETFLENIDGHLNTQPDFRVPCIADEIRPKTQVIYYPIEPRTLECSKSYDCLHIVWPHRWEHDKDPELFFETLYKLKDVGAKFKVSVLGESYTDPPEIFEKAKGVLREEIRHFGRLESKDDYFQVLNDAHIVVSTAKHEFFGVAMAEGVEYGCYPLAPNALVYPELYPAEYLYNTPQQLLKKLKMFCHRPCLVRERLAKFPIEKKFNADAIAEQMRIVFKYDV